MNKRNSGITLIEVIITMAITSIIGISLVSLQYILSQNQIAVTKSYKSVDDANFVVSNLEKEIRRASSSENGAYLLNLAGDQEIIFYSDIDLDGIVEWVRYYLDGNNIVKETIDPVGFPPVYNFLDKKTKVVSEDVRNNTTPIFYYYNEDWPTDTVNNPLESDDRLSETKTIKIYLRLNSDDNPEKDYSIESFVQIRSVKNNL